MKKRKTTNILLLIIVIPLVFYLLKILSFIFIPFLFSMFIALLFLPFMRFLNKKKVPKLLSVFFIVSIIVGISFLGFQLIKLTSNEILSTKDVFIEKAEVKILNLITDIEDTFTIDRPEDVGVFKYYSEKNNLLTKFSSTLDYVNHFITTILMSLFFAILLLMGSINFERYLNKIFMKEKYSSIRTFMKIENDMIKFVKVKFVISLFTGVGFTLACLFFDVSFPIFWGLFAFAINFIQMIGSVISVILLSLFGLVELDSTGTLLFFIIIITAVQVLFGAIIEPIFMGKTFKVNIITILIMLMFWGFIWGIPGLIFAIPITIIVKIILMESPKTKKIAKFISET